MSMMSLFARIGVTIDGTPANGTDIAIGKDADSKVANASSEPGFAVDGDLDTCFETMSVKDTSWVVSLDEVRIVTGIAMTVGDKC